MDSCGIAIEWTLRTLGQWVHNVTDWIDKMCRVAVMVTLWFNTQQRHLELQIHLESGRSPYLDEWAGPQVSSDDGGLLNYSHAHNFMAIFTHN